MTSTKPNALAGLRIIAAEYGALLELRDHREMGHVVHFWREADSVTLDVQIKGIEIIGLRQALRQTFGNASIRPRKS